MNVKGREELKRAAEMKAMCLINGNNEGVDIWETKAYELCWTRKPQKEFDIYNQEAYEEYYAYYQFCVDTLENGGKLKAEKINKVMTVKQRGSMVVGGCSYETPYLYLVDENGINYAWVSNTVEEKDMLAYDYEKLHIIAYVRPGNGHLYKVSADKVYN